MLQSTTMGLEKVPASLKESAPFVLRANEIDRVDGVVAYWCTCGARDATKNH